MVPRKQDVVRLDVSMCSALLVRGLQCVRDVAKNSDRVGDRQLAYAFQSGAKRLPFDAWHRVIEEVSLRARKEKRYDVRVLQPGRQLNLAAKAFHVEAGAELGRQNLDDDIATERDLADNEDARHAAAEVVSYLIPIAECPLKALGHIVHRVLVQASSTVNFRAKT